MAYQVTSGAKTGTGEYCPALAISGSLSPDRDIRLGGISTVASGIWSSEACTHRDFLAVNISVGTCQILLWITGKNDDHERTTVAQAVQNHQLEPRMLRNRMHYFLTRDIPLR